MQICWKIKRSGLIKQQSTNTSGTINIIGFCVPPTSNGFTDELVRMSGKTLCSLT